MPHCRWYILSYLYITIIVSESRKTCLFRVYLTGWLIQLHNSYLVCDVVILLVFVHETIFFKKTYLSFPVDSGTAPLFNIVYIQMIRVKILKVAQVSLMRQSLLLFSPLPWRRKRILGNCKLISVALMMMMKVMKTMLIQKRVNLMTMRFVQVLSCDGTTKFWIC